MWLCARRPSTVIQGRKNPPRCRKGRRATKHRPTSHLGGDTVGLNVYYLVKIQSSNGLFGSVQRRAQSMNMIDISGNKRWTLTKIYKRRLERGEESWASALVLSLAHCGGTSARWWVGKQHTKHPTPTMLTQHSGVGYGYWLWL